MAPEKKKFRTGFVTAILLCAVFILSACSRTSPGATPQPVSPPAGRAAALTPFIFASRTASSPALPVPTITPFPSLTPTPRTHVVKKGEDMGGIAYLYKITLEELMAANPGVKPNLMSVGTALIIPGTAESAESDATPQPNPSPTALPVDLGPVFCTQTREGGVWCSQLIHNPQDVALEGLSGVFHLVDQDTQAITSQTAFLPLDLILPGQSLPISAFFPPPMPAAFQASAEIKSSLPNPDDGRYLRTRIDDQEINLAENGLSASVKFTLSLEQAETAAQRVRVAVIAYDKQGFVIGIRRWEKTENLQLNPGQALSISFPVYSNAGPIQRIEIAAEARP